MPHASEWNRLVNDKWPSDMPVPTDKEAITGAKRLYRRAMGKPFKGEVVVTSGNRYTWIRGGVMSVNPNRRNSHPQKGWPDIVHLLAHYCHSRKYPYAKPHDRRELDLEADLTNYVLSQGFHEGKLKRVTIEKPILNHRAKIADRRATKLSKAKETLKRWESKQKRADTAIKKYRQKIRYYEKFMEA